MVSIHIRHQSLVTYRHQWLVLASLAMVLIPFSSALHDLLVLSGSLPLPCWYPASLSAYREGFVLTTVGGIYLIASWRENNYWKTDYFMGYSSVSIFLQDCLFHRCFLYIGSYSRLHGSSLEGSVCSCMCYFLISLLRVH